MDPISVWYRIHFPSCLIDERRLGRALTQMFIRPLELMAQKNCGPLPNSPASMEYDRQSLNQLLALPAHMPNAIIHCTLLLPPSPS